MRVADFYCGAGGFSEGFRLAGVDVVFAVDKWKPAVDTHHANHPECNTRLADVEKLSLLPEDEFHTEIPDTEIIIGSPPCVAFSNSNKSGKGDKKLGIRLLKAFLRIVARKKFRKDSLLKYWVLENVPNIEKYLKPYYTAADLGLSGNFVLRVLNDSSGVYNAKYFGVASNRNRFLCGEFPRPEQLVNDDINVKTLKTILEALGNPGENLESVINDPNHQFQMRSYDMTDHHYVKEVAEFEWKKAKRLKEDKGYMGRMAFPENVDRPARTVMATMSFSSRESMIFRYKEGKYRAPSVREVASIMSFPIDYRFYGSSIGMKYKLVGNAVPPLLAKSVATAILEAEGAPVARGYSPHGYQNQLDFYNLNSQLFHLNIEKPKKPNARFKYHIPYMLINAFRVELTNHESDFEKCDFRWDVEIHKSQGKNAKRFTPVISDQVLPPELVVQVQEYVKSLRKDLVGLNEFQRVYCLPDRDRTAHLGPYELLEKTKSFITGVLKDEDKQAYLKIADSPNLLPLQIALGYITLKKIINEMEML